MYSERQLPSVDDNAVDAIVMGFDVVQDRDRQFHRVRHQTQIVGLGGLQHGLADVAAAFQDGDRSPFQSQARWCS